VNAQIKIIITLVFSLTIFSFVSASSTQPIERKEIKLSSRILNIPAALKYRLTDRIEDMVEVKRVTPAGEPKGKYKSINDAAQANEDHAALVAMFKRMKSKAGEDIYYQPPEKWPKE